MAEQGQRVGNWLCLAQAQARGGQLRQWEEGSEGHSACRQGAGLCERSPTPALQAEYIGAGGMGVGVLGEECPMLAILGWELPNATPSTLSIFDGWEVLPAAPLGQELSPSTEKRQLASLSTPAHLQQGGQQRGSPEQGGRVDSKLVRQVEQRGRQPRLLPQVRLQEGQEGRQVGEGQAAAAVLLALISRPPQLGPAERGAQAAGAHAKGPVLQGERERRRRRQSAPGQGP